MSWVDPRVGLGWSGWVEIFDYYTTYEMIQLQGTVQVKYNGHEKLAFSTTILLYFENGTRYDHSCNGRPLTADSFAVSCIGLG